MSAMFGKKVKEYIRFEWWILILIVMVFALRLSLSLAGASKAEYPVMTLLHYDTGMNLSASLTDLSGD